ncbi:MAG: TonB-dependent receptor [Bryobacterales bacterium]|nr:TonB-dependent receptor [Bryobacterales bacterium]
MSEAIEVSGAAPLIETGSSSLGQVIETKLIQELPLNGRNFVQLATLGPGVTGVGFGARGTIMNGTRPADLRPGSEIFSNGNREGANNFLYDGVDNNVRQNFAITLRPSVEAVREFKIQTNLFAAEQGRNPGATINVITKSGSNEWHGSAYEFLRNSNFDAREYFAAPGAAKPAFRQNQFGASVGGRIRRDKLFFFANYEGYRRSLETVSVNTVPLEAVRGGDFSAVRDVFDPFSVRAQSGTPSGFVRDPFPGRRIPANRFDPVTARLIQAYPLPQRAGLVNNHTSNPKDRQSWNQGDLRGDWNAGSKDQVFARFSRQDTLTLKPSTFQPVTVPGMNEPVSLGNEGTFAGESNLITHHAVLGWTRTLSPTFLLDARMGYVRYDLNYSQEGASDGARLGEKLGVLNSNQGPRSDGIPIFSPAGYTGIGQTRSLPIVRVENTFHPSVSLTRILGAHSVKTGFEARRRQMSEFQNNRGSGRFNFDRVFTANPNQTATSGDAMAGFLLGTASVIEQDFLLTLAGIRATEFGSFVQDDWRVNNRLTFNLGIRYEYDTPFSEVANRWANFDQATGKMRLAGVNSDRNVGVQRDSNNFAPRFGFAYQLRSTTVVRGGYGVYYNTQGHGGVAIRLQRQLPFGPINAENVNQFSSSPRRVIDGFRPIPPLDPAVVANNPTGSVLSMPEDFKSGYTQQFNLQVQHQLPWGGVVVKAGYVGNLGRQLHATFNSNQPEPGPGGPATRRPFRLLAPNVVDVTRAATDGISNYHAFQATAEKRFTRNLGFLTSYTWSHSIDNVGLDFGGGADGPVPQDIRNRHSAERATSAHDMQHRLVHSMNYALPAGKGQRWDPGSALGNAILGDWQVNTIFTSQTGLPFTPTLAAPVSNAGASRPDRLSTGSLDNPTPTRWFDTSFNTAGAAWANPAQFTFGNAGRHILRGPGRVNLDFSLFKAFVLREQMRLQFRAEFFNLFNTPQFDAPNASIGSPNAGIITTVLGNPRQVQFALRFSF